MTRFLTYLRPALVGAGLLLSAGCLAPAHAQGPPPGPPGGPGDPAAVPLDGGASLLLAAGVGFGLARLRKGRRPVGH